MLVSYLCKIRIVTKWNSGVCIDRPYLLPIMLPCILYTLVGGYIFLLTINPSYLVILIGHSVAISVKNFIDQKRLLDFLDADGILDAYKTVPPLKPVRNAVVLVLICIAMYLSLSYNWLLPLPEVIWPEDSMSAFVSFFILISIAAIIASWTSKKTSLKFSEMFTFLKVTVWVIVPMSITLVLLSPSYTSIPYRRTTTPVSSTQEQKTTQENTVLDIEETPNDALENEKVLMLVNSWNPIPDDYTIDLAAIPNDLQADSLAAPYITMMLNDAKDAGHNLYILSAYRANNRQKEIYESKKAEYLAAGNSEEEADRLTSQIIAPPGTSEHETGLALDIVTEEHPDLDESFAQIDAYQWLLQNGPDYGFILRYPADKETITGIAFEPWHFRFVGVENAQEMTSQGLVLEEYTKQS